MVLVKYIIGIGMAVLTLFSCTNEKSLQRYLVDKQEDDSFLKVDIAASLLQTDNNSLTKEEKEVLKTIKKINVIAFPIKENGTTEYESEKKKLKTILNQEKYKTLMKFGSKNKGAILKYLGKENAIDEIIVFASDDEKGFALFRLLGNKMRPEKMIKLLEALDKGDLDISSLESIGKIFDM